MAEPLRTTEQVRDALSKFFGANAPSVLVQPGSGPQDNIDTYSQEAGRLYVILTFDNLASSIPGLRDLIADTTESSAFRDQLQEALELTDGDFSDFIDSAVDDFAANYGLTRLPATAATLTLRFYTTALVPGTISLGTTARTPGLNTIEYTTSIDVVSQPVTPDPQTGLYYIDVPAEATIAGTSSRVPINRVTELSPPIAGFTSVTNITASSGGTDEETNEELLDRCVNAMKGRELDTVYGLDQFVRGQAGVEDALVVDTSDPLMTRGSGSEVDIYVIAENQQAATDNVTFESSIMVDSVILNRQPVVAVSQVRVNSVVQVPGADYEFVKDTGGFAGSNIAVDKVRFFSGHIPLDGDAIAVDYVYNSSIGDLQNLFELPENDIPNSDILIKQAVKILVDMEITIVKFSNYSNAQVQANVTTALETFFDALGLDDDVYVSDVVNVIENTDGVDRVNVPFTKMAPVGQVGASDIAVSKNEYARLNSVVFL